MTAVPVDDHPPSTSADAGTDLLSGAAAEATPPPAADPDDGGEGAGLAGVLRASLRAETEPGPVPEAIAEAGSEPEGIPADPDPVRTTSDTHSIGLAYVLGQPTETIQPRVVQLVPAGGGVVELLVAWGADRNGVLAALTHLRHRILMMDWPPVPAAAEPADDEGI